MVLKKLNLLFLLLSFSYVTFATKPDAISNGLSQTDLDQIADAVALKMKPGWFSYVVNSKTVFWVGLPTLGTISFFLLMRSIYPSPKDDEEKQKRITEYYKDKIDSTTAKLGSEQSKNMRFFDSYVVSTAEMLKRFYKRSEKRIQRDEEMVKSIEESQESLNEATRQAKDTHMNIQSSLSSLGGEKSPYSMFTKNIAAEFQSFSGQQAAQFCALHGSVKTFRTTMNNNITEFKSQLKTMEQEKIQVMKQLKKK